MFVLPDPALAGDLIESEDELFEAYDGRGRSVRACGEPGQVTLALVSEEPHDQDVREHVERYYSVFAARHPTRIPPQQTDLAAFIRAVAEDWVEE
ncbi:hypothetical protein ACIP6X_40330 [Streptomyces coeruleorubidus]|uniref:hypothetical protein n=1 Tax=Streptomyces coeruleorubidus TaxID=116188 RepID=UPI00382FAC5F